MRFAFSSVTPSATSRSAGVAAGLRRCPMGRGRLLTESAGAATIEPTRTTGKEPNHAPILACDLPIRRSAPLERGLCGFQACRGGVEARRLASRAALAAARLVLILHELCFELPASGGGPRCLDVPSAASRAAVAAVSARAASAGPRRVPGRSLDGGAGARLAFLGGSRALPLEHVRHIV